MINKMTQISQISHFYYPFNINAYFVFYEENWWYDLFIFSWLGLLLMFHLPAAGWTVGEEEAVAGVDSLLWPTVSPNFLYKIINKMN